MTSPGPQGLDGPSLFGPFLLKKDDKGVVSQVPTAEALGALKDLSPLL